MNFSPSSANVRGPQRANEVASFGLQFFLRRNQRLHLRPEIAVRLAPRNFHLLNLCIDFGKGLADRCDQIGDRFLPGFQSALGLALEAF